MAAAVRIALLLLLILSSAAALLFLLPSLKEGYDIEELAKFLGVTAALAALWWIWWRVCRKWQAPGLRGLFSAGAVVLVLPTLAYAWLSGSLVYYKVLGDYLARHSKISRLTVQPITWPGFDGPVGLRLEIELEHEIGRTGNLMTPRILKGGPEFLTHGDYYRRFPEYELAFLGVPVFSGPAAYPTLKDHTARLTYEVYPSIVRKPPAPDKVCLDPFTADRKRSYESGSYLTASWFFAGPGGLRVDLGRPLSEALRARTAEVGDWSALLRRLEPAGLEAAGFRPCTGPELYGERCYCR